MNESDLNPNAMDAGTVPAENAAQAEKETPRKSVADVIGDAVKRGKSDACEAARQAAPKIKNAVEKGTFKLAYGAAFGAGFGLAVLKELVPQMVKEGVKEGVRAGADAADKAFTPEEKAAEEPAEAQPVVIV